MAYLLLTAGIAMLLIGGTSLVRGASGIARTFRVSNMVIGLTVVAFGTSTPELVVNIVGAVNDQTDLAFGNAVGSNLANFGLVLGIAAMLSPIHLQGQVVRREVPFLLLITAILMVMVADASLSSTVPLLDRGDAIILFLLFTVFIYFLARDVISEQSDPILLGAVVYSARERTVDRVRIGMAGDAVQIVVGIGLLTWGGHLTIEQGAIIAALLHVPEVVIGIFVVAVGTSLPELITSCIAAYRKESDLALGNIVGSNIFNSLVVLPAAAIVRPIPIPTGGAVDIVVGFLFVLAVIPLFLFSNARIGRTAGALLLGSYAGYLVYRFIA